MWKRKKAKEKENVEADEPTLAPDVHDAPTEPAPKSPARALADDDATVRTGSDTKAESYEPQAADTAEPHPAKSDAPTVAMDPSFERKIPDPPSVENGAAPVTAPENRGDDTVQVGQRTQPEAAVPSVAAKPEDEDAAENGPPSKDLDPTIPMGRRRS